MPYVKWDEIPETKKGEDRFLKWKQGKNKVRLIGKLCAYDQEWPSGMATRYVHLVIDVDDENKVKVATLKKSVLDTIRTYAQEIGDPAGPDAPGFIVVLKGSGMESKYQCISGSKPVPIPPEIDVAAEQKKLDEFVEKQVAKLTGKQPTDDLDAEE